jgi:hypothetical protein
VTRLRALSLAVLLLAAAGISACGSSSSDDATDTTEASSSKTTASDSNDNGSSVDDFASDLQKGKNVEFDATYESKTSGGTDASTFRVAQKKPKSLFETTSGDSTTTIINDGTDTFVCSKSGTEDVTCIKSPSGSGASSAAAPMLALVDAGNIAQTLRGYDRLPGIDVSRSSKTFAGEKATCVSVKVRGGGAGNDGTWCATDSGVIAYVESGGSTLELTDFSTDVSDSTFELPAEPQSY